jgi:beta-xylosidase
MIDAFPFVDPQTGERYLYLSRTRAAHTSNVIAGVKMKDWRTPDYDTYTELTKVNYTTLEGTEVTERFEGYEPNVVNSGNAINEAPNMIYHDGTYYLTYSACATTDPEYSVMQALGSSPLGPFEKVQESHGGCVVGVQTESLISVWDHVLCTGSHSFVYDGDELWVV